MPHLPFWSVHAEICYFNKETAFTLCTSIVHRPLEACHVIDVMLYVSCDLHLTGYSSRSTYRTGPAELLRTETEATSPQTWVGISLYETPVICTHINNLYYKTLFLCLCLTQYLHQFCVFQADIFHETWGGSWIYIFLNSSGAGERGGRSIKKYCLWSSIRGISSFCASP